MQTGVGQVLIDTLNTTLISIVAFLPKLLSGFIVLLIGIIIGSFLKQVVLELAKIFKIDSLLNRYGVSDAKEKVNWVTIFAELVRWFVIIMFLIPVADVWGLGRFTEVLNGLLLYLPNVFIAILVLLVGFVISKLVADLIMASVHGLSRESARTLGNIGRWSVLVFVFLIALNQLGIASDLIRILFAGFVAMVALAGGLAFGLGGKDSAAEILQKLKKRV